MHSESEVRKPAALFVNHGDIRSQLERILASEVFKRSERIIGFLRFVVEQSLDGHGDTLKEQVLAVGVYGKSTDFHPGDDAAVRNDARRLRDKLREYYAAFPDDPIVISLPKGGYAPVFELRAPPSESSMTRKPEQPRLDARSRRQSVGLAAVAALLAAALSVGLWPARQSTPEHASWRVVPVSSLPGSETAPALSPDGNFVVFGWSGADNSDVEQTLLIKAVGKEVVHSLATLPANVNMSAWSPDSKLIAFSRGNGISLMSPLGGTERKVSDGGILAAWLPDSRSIIVDNTFATGERALYQISLDTLQRRQLTHPPAGQGDYRPAVSPDGKTVAFIRGATRLEGDVYVAPIAGGEPQRRTNWNAAVDKVVWMPNGRELLYSAGYSYALSLWRVPAFGDKPDHGSRILETNAIQPTLSRPNPGQPLRLAFLTVEADFGLRLIDLESPLSGDLIPTRSILDSTLVEYPGSLSWDGRKIAFTSNRGEQPPGAISIGFGGQLWTANRDGTNPLQITRISSPPRHPSWSPDGRWIAFDANVDGNTDVYIVSSAAGEPRRLTEEAARDWLPTWSHDGRSLFFTSERTGRAEIWKASPETGEVARITRNGGREPIESMDGRLLYYLDPRDSQLKQVPVDGGEEVLVLEGVTPSVWSVTEKGIYFLTRQPDVDFLKLYDPRSRTTKSVGRLPFAVTPIGGLGRLAVSRDGRWALTLREDRWERDIAMIDDFH